MTIATLPSNLPISTRIHAPRALIMALKQIVGRVLLLLMFFGASMDKLSNPGHSQALLNSRYAANEKFYGQLGLPLPLSSATVLSFSGVIIQVMGALMLIGSVLTLFNLKYGPCILTAQMVMITVIIHNPMLATTSQDTQNELIQALKNLAVIGGLMQICCQQCTSGAKTEPTPATEKGKKKVD